MSRLALDIRTDRSPNELRRPARRQANPAASARIYAIANALNGMSRAEAARLARMERPALRAAVVHYNVEGLEGLHDRLRSGRKPRLGEQHQDVLDDGEDQQQHQRTDQRAFECRGAPSAPQQACSE